MGYIKLYAERTFTPGAAPATGEEGESVPKAMES